MFAFLRKLFPGVAEGKTVGTGAGEGKTIRAGTRSVDELARWLRVDRAELRSTVVSYTTFTVPKRTGGQRTLLAPDAPLKRVQRQILRRLLAKLQVHPCATGFERGHSIVTNARPHVGQEVVIKFDVRDFFGSTDARRVRAYFRFIGWDDEAADLLTQLCTYNGALPQGAPTSPRLSNLVNQKLDERLAKLADHYDMGYSRYADDITLSGKAMLPVDSVTNPKTMQRSYDPRVRATTMIYAVKHILSEFGYRLHTEKKLRIARRHDRQLVTGLVVNQKVQLPRKTRRWLRAVEHRLATKRESTLTPEQLAGWRSLERMVKEQSAA